MEMGQTTVLCFKGNFQYFSESAFVMWKISKFPGGPSTLVLTLFSEKSVSFLSWICKQQNLTNVVTKIPLVPDGLTAVILSFLDFTGKLLETVFSNYCSLTSQTSFIWQRRPTTANFLKLSGKVFRVLLVAKLSRHLTFVSFSESTSWFLVLLSFPASLAGSFSLALLCPVCSLV